MQYDGIWRAERLTSGAWVVAKHVDFGIQKETIVDGKQVAGEFVRKYHDTFAQADARAKELNASAKK